MVKYFYRILGGMLAMLMVSDVYAADSYRFLHVSIDTPWLIFIFLLIIILIPFILMAVLYWYFAFKKDTDGKSDKESGDVVRDEVTVERE